MADFSCASTKRTSQAPMSWEAPVRFRVSVVVAALVLTGCNANQEVNLSSRRPPESSPARTTILTIPSATHRTTPGIAAVAANRRRSSRSWPLKRRGPLAGRNRPKKTGSPAPRASCRCAR